MMRGRATIAAAWLAAAGLLIGSGLIASGCGGGSSSGGAAGGAPSSSSGAVTSGAASAASPASKVDAKIDAIVLITIDTLRADRVGAYGWRAARTPAMDALAARGVRVEQAYAPAPITLPSHASLLTGVYPSRHGARHNGMRVKANVPTLAELLRARGFATGAFIAAFPLDRRFGLDRGFDVYGDTLPRGPDGRPRNERSGRSVVDDALAWVAKAAPPGKEVFLWVHLFEPHAPYEADASMGAGGHSSVGRSMSDRYDDEIARADRQVARVVEAFASRRASTVFIVAGDHGEAFGEHGEVGHSLFVYDSTLRVPLILAGPGIDIGGSGDRSDRGDGPYVDRRTASLIDVVPTVLQLVGAGVGAAGAEAAGGADVEVDGQSLVPLNAERQGRELYAESFAPLLDFGWSPLRAMRADRFKYIAAPKPELYDVTQDPAESQNLVASPDRADWVTRLAMRADSISPADLVITPDSGKSQGSASAASSANPASGASAAGTVGAANADREALARLQSLGYIGAKTNSSGGATISAKGRPDPKDRVELAARIGQVTSGELQGPALRAALERIVRDDPKNGQMRMRLAFVLQESGACAAAVPHFEAAIAAGIPSADPHLGLAECLSATGRRDAAHRALIAADRIEPGNPIVSANLGLMALDAGRVPEAIERLKAALARIPDLHEARFALIRAYARDGSRDDAAREARELLARMPPDAPQRAEVERLLSVVQ